MRTKKNSGLTLVLSLLATSVMLTLTTPYISRVVTDYNLTSRIYNSVLALDLAEAGAERAFTDSSFSGLAALDDMGEYYVERNVSAGGTTTIKSTGYVPNRASYKAKRVINITFVKQYARKAIRASGTGPGAITLGVQDKIDSYNSDEGTYDETHTNSNGDIETNGSIVFGVQAKVYGDANPGPGYSFSSKPSGVYGSWGTLSAPIVLDQIPQATLDGGVAAARTVNDNNSSNIITAYPADPWPLDGDNNLSLGMQKSVTLAGGHTYYFKSVTLSTQSTINVTAGAAPTVIYVEKMGTSGSINIGTQGSLNLAGTTSIYLNHGSGTKSGDLIVGSQGSVNINGKSTIYVDGGDINVNTQGNINTATQVPKNLSVYSSGNNIGLTTQSDFYGSVYAPNAAVALTTQGEIFGSVTSSTINSGVQAAIHFDRALLNEPTVFDPSPGVTSWQDAP